MQEQRLPATASKQAAGSRAFRSARTRRRPRPPHGESASRWIRTGGEAPVGGGAHAERTWGRGVWQHLLGKTALCVKSCCIVYWPWASVSSCVKWGINCPCAADGPRRRGRRPRRARSMLFPLALLLAWC